MTEGASRLVEEQAYGEKRRRRLPQLLALSLPAVAQKKRIIIRPS